jgi:hypothetical protein
MPFFSGVSDVEPTRKKMPQQTELTLSIFSIRTGALFFSLCFVIMIEPLLVGNKREQCDYPCLFDCRRQFPLMLCADARHAGGNDFTPVRYIPLERFRVFIVDICDAPLA